MSAAPRRILVRAPTWLGDAVLATPALRALRAGHPEAEIAVEGRPEVGELLHGLSSFDVFLPDARRGLRGARERARTLREGRFDLAVLLPDSVRAALGPARAGIPRRVGYARDPLRRALLTEEVAPRRRHAPVPMIPRYLAIARHVGCPERGRRPELAVRPAAADRVDKELRARGVESGEGILVVTPGASFGPSKLWPARHVAAACDALARTLSLRPVLAPGPGEEDLARDIAARAREPVVCWTDLPSGPALLVALVARARLVLTNDTGPRHVAAALDRPAVVIMGPTDPRITASPDARERVLREEFACSPCQLRRCPVDHRCLERLSPERAVAAAAALLDGS